MNELGSLDSFRFGGFRFDRAAGCLYRTNGSGVAEPVVLGSRALAVLALLVERQGQLLSKDAIFATVWPGIVVGDGNLAVQISALRRVLDRGRTQGSCIQTIPGRGYRFVAPVTRFEADALVSAPGFGEGWDGTLAVVGQPDRQSAMFSIDGSAAAPTPSAPYRLSAAPRLSIVVLPFTNLTNDPEQQYFADGITDDLTTDLSRIANMLVISRNTAFTYRNKPVDTKQIGRELNVRYVLEGSVRRLGERVRVNAQLIDAETDAHLWAERFDGDTSDLFALQDEITSRIANTLGVELIAAEAARPTKNLDALDYILRGRAVRNRPTSPDVLAEAISLFEHALALDPRSVEAQSLLAGALADRLLDFGSNTYDSDLQRADGLTLKALAIAPRNLLARLARGNVLRVQGHLEEAISEYQSVLAYNPNHVGALAAIGRCKIFIGPIEQGIPAQERAIRLSPRDPQTGLWYFRIGQAHLFQSHVDEAILWLERARHANPEIPFIRAYLAAAYSLHGDQERAATQLAEAQRLDGAGNFSSIAREKHRQSLNQNRAARPKIRELIEATYFAGLRKAGLPEE